MPVNNWNDDVRNSLITLVSGGQNALLSGLTPVLAPFIGTVSLGAASLSGMGISITASTPAWVIPDSTFKSKISGLNVAVQSGLGVINTDVTHSSVAGSSFIVGIAATQFPAQTGRRHLIRLGQSGVVYIGGSAVVSGGGYVLAGDIDTPTAGMELQVNNLNLVYGLAVTSTQVTFVSFG